MLSGLQKRVLTAAILIPLVILGVFGLPTAGAAIVAAILMVLAAWEWCGLSGWPAAAARIAYMALVAALIAAIWFGAGEAGLTIWPLWFACAAWLLIMPWMSGRPVEQLRAMQGRGPASLLVGLLVLVPTWLGMTVLHGLGESGPAHLMLLLLMVWGADSGAYFAGKRWGKAKLAPAISPGKTRAGGVGALLTVLVLAVLGGWLLGYKGGAWLGFIALALVTGVFSIYGDLLESVLKRVAGAKDSGSMVPGHGGVLDRLDSLTAAAPVFALGVALLEGFA